MMQCYYVDNVLFIETADGARPLAGGDWRLLENLAGAAIQTYNKSRYLVKFPSEIFSLKEFFMFCSKNIGKEIILS